MSDYIMFTNALGTFLLNPKGKIIEQRLHSKNPYEQHLSQSEWHNDEREILDAYPNTIVIGTKKEPYKGITAKVEPKEYQKITGSLIHWLAPLRSANITITKAQVAASVNDDDRIVAVRNAFSDLNKDSARLTVRFREWLSLYDQDILRLHPDHEELLEYLSTKGISPFGKYIVMTQEHAQSELHSLQQMMTSLRQMNHQKKEIATYLSELMERRARNVTKIAGFQLAAELLSHAGSLQKLAMVPASTIQLYGAEKALFRHLRNRNSKPPKHGVLVNHPLVSGALPKNKGKAVRAIADKLSIAAKVDFFKGEFVADKMLEDLEKKLRQYGANSNT